ncbi:MAG TPA: DUF5691 domain-containing protein [Streptosporangiaceae bacterium]|nr:DUF5691 domain-containing protein [Streptosporangiaceae bacterium]
MTGQDAGLSWADLVDAATVGLTRRPLRSSGPVELAGSAGAHGGVLDGSDPAGTVLDAAALVSAAQRAGVQAADGVHGPGQAEPDTAPELPARAAGVVRRAMAADLGVLADLLGEAGRRGYRVPAPMLPALLDVAVRDTGLRAAVAGVLGQRGRWLAGYRPDWQRVAAAGVPRVPDDSQVWETGRRDERLGYLTQRRAQDPAAARELLAAGWDRETGDDRALLLGVLAGGLGAADETFLTAALADRKGAVREEAARLLAKLPGSAFSRRAADRAAGLLRVERHALRRRLIAERPAEGKLAAVVAAAPLGLWEERFGLAPGQIVALPVEGRPAAEVQAGWRVAAIREASPVWAEALLAVGPEALRAGAAAGADGSFGRGAAGWRDPAEWRRPPEWPKDAELATVLSPQARAARGVALLTGAARGTAAGTAALDEVARYPRPWADELARAVLEVVWRSTEAGPGRWSGPLLAAAARNLPVTGPIDYAAALTELADTSPAAWSAPLRRTAGAVAARRTFAEEIR